MVDWKWLVAEIHSVPTPWAAMDPKISITPMQCKPQLDFLSAIAFGHDVSLVMLYRSRGIAYATFYLNLATPGTSLMSSNFSPIFTTEYLINRGSKLMVRRRACCARALASKRMMKWWP
jgi:hypothetical protein